MTDLLQAIQSLATRPLIPSEVDLWDGAHISAYLKCSQRQVMERYAALPDFPRAIRLPSAAGMGHPRWVAKEVMEWALKHRERQ